MHLNLLRKSITIRSLKVICLYYLYLMIYKMKQMVFLTWIYNLETLKSIEVNTILGILKTFWESPDELKRKIFCCISKNLFEEYKFLTKDFKITAKLYGCVIMYNFISNHKTLDHALRFVLNALKTPPEFQMYVFGIPALDCFKCCLCDHD